MTLTGGKKRCREKGSKGGGNFRKGLQSILEIIHRGRRGKEGWRNTSVPAKGKATKKKRFNGRKKGRV